MIAYIFGLLIEPDNYVPIMDAVAKDTPLMDLTQGILFKGFKEGKLNLKISHVQFRPSRPFTIFDGYFYLTELIQKHLKEQYPAMIKYQSNSMKVLTGDEIQK